MTDQTNSDARHKNCSICSQLKDYERGLQVHGREEEDTFLPKVGSQIKIAKYLKSKGERHMYVGKCPECGTHYLFKSDYEYLATGSVEEQLLQRLTEEEAAKYLAWPEEK
jgi:hypothetical protein